MLQARSFHRRLAAGLRPGFDGRILFLEIRLHRAVGAVGREEGLFVNRIFCVQFLALLSDLFRKVLFELNTAGKRFFLSASNTSTTATRSRYFIIQMQPRMHVAFTNLVRVRRRFLDREFTGQFRNTCPIGLVITMTAGGEHLQIIKRRPRRDRPAARSTCVPGR